MKDSVENARNRYASVPDLDLHFYGMKGYGIYDKGTSSGKPKFHLIGQDKLFSVVPLISSDDSPYVFGGSGLTYKGEGLPFRVKYIGRVRRNPAYFYYRGIREWMPTLDSESVLGINFQPVCKGCEWCCRDVEKEMNNIPPEEGVEILKKNGVDLPNIDKMTFVTGMYKDGDEAADSILRTLELTKKEGFKGRVLYIGSQIAPGSQIKRLLDGLGETRFKYAYTVETFNGREKMHKKKTFPLEHALDALEGLREDGVTDLEYSYMPGIDPLDEFSRWMPKFSRLARPHLSIFRPVKRKQEEFKDAEFSEDPVGYLCSMRTAFEEEHGGPVYQNNLASLWGFPLDRINPLFLTEKTSL